jgi:polyferredoxin
MTGKNCDLFTHKSSRSYSNHLVLEYLLITFLHFSSFLFPICFVLVGFSSSSFGLYLLPLLFRQSPFSLFTGFVYLWGPVTTSYVNINTLNQFSNIFLHSPHLPMGSTGNPETLSNSYVTAQKNKYDNKNIVLRPIKHIIININFK